MRYDYAYRPQKSPKMARMLRKLLLKKLLVLLGPDNQGSTAEQKTSVPVYLLVEADTVYICLPLAKLC